MAVALTLVLALAMIAAGSFAAYLGYDDVLEARSQAQMVGGAVVATGGALLLGLALVLARLGRLAAEVARLRERPARPEAGFPEPPAHLAALPSLPIPPAPDPMPPEPSPAQAAAGPPVLKASEPAPPERAVDDVPTLAAEVAPEPAPPSEPAPSAEAAPAEPHVIGTHASGGNAYVMYSDGSILAETPDGSFRFASLEELREFTASRGETVGYV